MYNMYLNQQSIITTFTFNFHADGWDISELTQLKGSEGSGVTVQLLMLPGMS